MEWEWWDDINTFRVFSFLLLAANWKDNKYLGMNIPRGSIAISQSQLAAKTSLTIRQARTSLSHLESTGEVTVNRQAKFSVITLVNYDSYVSSDRDSDRETTGDRQASDRETTGERQASDRLIEEEKKESKNINNINNTKEGEEKNLNTPPTPPTGSKPTRKPRQTVLESNVALFDKLILLYSMSPELTDKARDWVLYKGERKEAYQEQGLKSLLTQIESHEREYGSGPVISLIDECMGNSYKGIIWDRLKKGNPARGSGSAYLDRIDNRYKVIDEWYRGDTNDEGRIFETGEGIEVDVSGPEIHGG